MPTRRRTFIKTASISTAALGGLAGCLSRDLGESDYSRKIGFGSALTGPLTNFGQALEQGARIALDEINEDLDDEFEMLVDDTEGGVEAARTVFREMIEDDCVVLTGPVSSDVGVGMRELVMSEEVPMLAPIVTNPDVTQPGTDFMYRAYGNGEQLALGVLEYYQSEGVETIAAIYADYTYGHQFKNYLDLHRDEFGIDVDWDTFVPLGTDNFRPELSNVDRNEIDALLTIYPGENAVVLVRQAQEEDLIEDMYHVGGNVYGSNPFLNALDDEVENVGYVGVDRETPEAETFIEQMDETFGQRAETINFLGYDSTRAAMEAVLAAEDDELTPENVNQELKNNVFSSASGYDMDFSDRGVNETFTTNILRWSIEDGEPVTNVIYRSDPIPPQES